MLVILHSGETGVERGAHHGARIAGLSVAGFMPPDARDELGRIPLPVAEHLQPWRERGRREAQLANVEAAGAVLLVMPEEPRIFRQRAGC